MQYLYAFNALVNFNPRTPQGGATPTLHKTLTSPLHFNPRTPQGGATYYQRRRGYSIGFQSTHPARGCDAFELFVASHRVISIHAPRKGVRLGNVAQVGRTYNFNPRTPQGGATNCVAKFVMFAIISIHAPRKGVRHAIKHYKRIADGFQSTHPARGCDFLTR